MPLTTDRSDPRLNDKKEGQNSAYLVLSDEELAKGFIRPVRYSYIHTGDRPDPKNTLRDLTEAELKLWEGQGFTKFEEYPESQKPASGKFWTAQQLNAPICGAKTTMGIKLAETYARDPKFYGGTFCVACNKHFPVAEFKWEGTDLVMGS